MVGGTTLTQATKGKILASTFTLSLLELEMETETGNQGQHAKVAAGETGSDYTGTSLESGTTSVVDAQKQRFKAQLTGDKVTLLKPNLDMYKLSADTPVVLVEKCSYSWSELAGPELSETPPPPPSLFVRVHPIKVGDGRARKLWSLCTHCATKSLSINCTRGKKGSAPLNLFLALYTPS